MTDSRSRLSAESLALLARLRQQTGKWVRVSAETYDRLPLFKVEGIRVEGRVGKNGRREVRLP